MSIAGKATEPHRSTVTSNIVSAPTGQPLGRSPAGGGSEDRLSEERVAEIRTRILRGAYDSVDVVNRVTRTILESGDL